jgi:hypothetical protein
MDGSEFLYIASRLDIPLYLYKSLEIQHNNRPMFTSYLKYKFRARKMIGSNFPLFPECYASSFQIKLVIALFALLQPLMVTFMLTGGFSTVAFWVLLAYLSLLYFFGLRHLKIPLVFIFLAPCVFVTQVLMFTGFLWGVFRGMLTIRRNQYVLDYKVERYRVFCGGTD